MKASLENEFSSSAYKKSDQEIIGVLDLISDYPEKDVWFIGFILVDPDFRNQSIGTRIIRELGKEIKKLGGTQIRVSISKENIKGINFFQRVGFVEISQEENSLIMTKKLA